MINIYTSTCLQTFHNDKKVIHYFFMENVPLLLNHKLLADGDDLLFRFPFGSGFLIGFSLVLRHEQEMYNYHMRLSYF